MVDIRGEVRRVLDSAEPVGIDEVEETARLRRRRKRTIVGLGGGIGVGAAGIIVALLFESTGATTVTVGGTPSQAGNAPLSATLTVPASSVPAGGTLTGEVVVNNTGPALHISGCGSPFAAALTTPHYQPAILWPLCLGPVTIPHGRSTYSVEIDARYYNCTPTDTPPCREGQPLPTGDYEARVFEQGNALPLPSSTAIRVTPATLVQVPNVVGQTETTASRMLMDAGLQVTETRHSSSVAPFGVVIGEAPTPGTGVYTGSTVSIVVSAGT